MTTAVLQTNISVKANHPIISHPNKNKHNYDCDAVRSTLHGRYQTNDFILDMMKSAVNPITHVT